MDEKKPLVGVLMGSKSDLEVMGAARDVLEELGIPYEVRILSAHRCPDETLAYARAAEGRGLQAIVAGAGAAAHLAGVLAAGTLVPVFGVPISATPLNGLDALLATVQMPSGIPVGTLAIGKGGAANAALLAAQVIALHDPALREKLRARRDRRKAEVLATTV
jgi:5-(carboxyamino)imidazole ribonucleotide mutase